MLLIKKVVKSKIDDNKKELKTSSNIKQAFKTLQSSCFQV